MEADQFFLHKFVPCEEMCCDQFPPTITVQRSLHAPEVEVSICSMTNRSTFVVPTCSTTKRTPRYSKQKPQLRSFKPF